MKTIIGLGNPGNKYKNTRHNVGQMACDHLIQELGFKIQDYKNSSKLKSHIVNHKSCVVAKPTTYMNDSGVAVSTLIRFYNFNTDNLYVIHDDLDIKLGEYKIQRAVGPKEHNGLLSIYEKIGTKDFWHVRVGVDNRTAENRIAGEDYVLQDFTESEREIIDEVITKISGELL